MDSFDLSSTFASLVPQTPFIIIWIVGISLSIYFRKRDLKKFLLTSIAFGLFLLSAIIYPALLAWLTLNSNSTDLSVLKTSQTVFYLFSSLISVIGWVLLLIAIFRSEIIAGDEVVQKEGEKRTRSKRIKVLILISPIIFILLLIMCYITPELVSEITTKRYAEKPEWSPAPALLTSNNVDHYEISGACWDTENSEKHDNYFIDHPAKDVEVYYQREMEKYCLNDQGRRVIFYESSCMTSEGRMQDCREAHCFLRDEAPSLSEDFYVEIFQISNSTTLVEQHQDIWYATKHPKHEMCGE